MNQEGLLHLSVIVFHRDAHFRLNSWNSTNSSGCCRLCSSLQVCSERLDVNHRHLVNLITQLFIKAPEQRMRTQSSFPWMCLPHQPQPLEASPHLCQLKKTFPFLKGFTLWEKSCKKITIYAYHMVSRGLQPKIRRRRAKTALICLVRTTLAWIVGTREGKGSFNIFTLL